MELELSFVFFQSISIFFPLWQAKYLLFCGEFDEVVLRSQKSPHTQKIYSTHTLGAGWQGLLFHHRVKAVKKGRDFVDSVTDYVC